MKQIRKPTAADHDDKTTLNTNRNTAIARN
jgi:hypothetical protein